MKVIIISGPTATGKTDLSLSLAKMFGGEIVNFDSLLFYKELNIGTAKPSAKDMSEIPHHMIDVTSISRPINAFDFSKLCLPIIEKILNQDKIVYLVGGSGFYLQALLKGMYESPTTPLEITKRSDELYMESGISPFLDILKEHDPVSFQRYHENDHYRIRRAVEHFWANRTPLSELRNKKEEENCQIKSASIHGWDIIHIHLDIPKEEHLKIIEKRTDKMLKMGLINEVDQLLSRGFIGTEKPLKCIGYKEVLELKFGAIKSIEECRERIIISTRQLAKSQRTWFNRVPGKLVFHPINQHQSLINVLRNFKDLTSKGLTE